MNNTLKVLSLLLSYPDPEWHDVLPEMEAAIANDDRLKQATRDDLLGLTHRLAADCLAAQEAYVRLFDQTRSLSLHLFEHVHGDSRDRGQAMVDLAEVYAAHGLAIDRGELPDYLPLFLEYVSTLSATEACETLTEALHIVAALAERLKRQGSDYAAVMSAICEVCGEKVPASAVAPLLAIPDDDPADLSALDAIWEEEEVKFGGGQAACGPDRLRQRVRASNREIDSPKHGGRHHV
jgi:nitrate reductase delta subunit